jgi:HD-GYP domain-containing protein (c-di-GMP phosphodiesterase class II)
MKRYTPSELQSGMVLARSIFSPRGVPLLRAGTPLNQIFISRLKTLDLPGVYILEPGEEPDLLESDVIKTVTREKVSLDIKQAFQAVGIGKQIEMKTIYHDVDSILQELIENHSYVMGVVEVRNIDDYTYQHSINVCILCLLIGINMGLSPKDLQVLGVGSLLHDIGKAYVEDEILNKPGPLNIDEMRQVMRHTKMGFDHLRAYYDISLISSQVAYQHHERLNGSGYPRGLKGDQIHLFSRIVSVVDVYDAMTCDRVYKAGCLPYEALQFLQYHREKLFSGEVVDALADRIAPYPLGSRVILNTGEVAIVVKINQVYPDKPVLLVVDENKQFPPYELDLQENPKRFIARLANA